MKKYLEEAEMPTSSELSEYYSRLTNEQFALINRSDLTEEARACFDREIERRQSPEWQAAERADAEAFEAQKAPWILKHIRIVALICLIPGLAIVAFLLITRPGDVLIIAFYALHVLAGVGLIRFKPYGLVIATILSIVYILCPLSWYALWVLSRPEAKQLFRRKEHIETAASWSCPNCGVINPKSALRCDCGTTASPA